MDGGAANIISAAPVRVASLLKTKRGWRYARSGVGRGTQERRGRDRAELAAVGMRLPAGIAVRHAVEVGAGEYGRERRGVARRRLRRVFDFG